MKDEFIGPYHPKQNPFERDMVKWKSDMTKFMINQNNDPRRWFQVMMKTAEVINHQANQGNGNNLPPLTVEKGEIGDITLLTEF